jgi:hypothetical protein
LSRDGGSAGEIKEPTTKKVSPSTLVNHKLTPTEKLRIFRSEKSGRKPFVCHEAPRREEKILVFVPF